MATLFVGYIGANDVGSLGLAKRAELVLVPLYSQQVHIAESGEIDRLAAECHPASRNVVLKEDLLQRFNIKAFRHVEDREIFVVKIAKSLSRLVVPPDRVLNELAILFDVHEQIHQHEAGQLVDPGIDAATAARITRRHSHDVGLLQESERD